jgi:hypothetical protein
MAIFGEVSGRLAVEGRERLVYMRTRNLNVGTMLGMGRSALPLRQIGLAAIGLAAATMLSACASGGVTVANANADTEQLAPVQSGNVSTTALPPIGPNGEVQTQPSAPLDQTQVANAAPNGTLPPLAAPNSTGRDLSGGLTVEKLLGRWTVVSGANQCAINLTQTQKTGTSRYRASAPACPLKGLTQVASWTVAGSQVQLFDENGNLIAALILSGNRFIGTLSGGTGISMVG